MNRIIELIESIRKNTEHYADQDFYDVDIERIMKQFAIEMCRKQKQICSVNTECITKGISFNGEQAIDESVLNCSLPEELR